MIKEKNIHQVFCSQYIVVSTTKSNKIGTTLAKKKGWYTTKFLIAEWDQIIEMQYVPF